MAPWNKLPKDLQKAILAMIILYGGASVSCRLGPVICDPPPPPSVTPMICDPPPPPTTAPQPTATPTITPMICDPAPPPSITPMICDPPPPPPSGGGSRLELEDRLPLAEIRTVDIVWEDGLTFGAETPWPGARYRWSVSGGTLAGSGEGVVWQPPAEPGRYLLQVVADWGQAGLAVDALVLAVEEDGSVTIC
jgi:hypothetical protein